MNNKLYFQIIFIPMVIILLTVIAITSYNVIALQNYKKELVDKITDDFIEQNKQKVHHDVTQFITDIDYVKKQATKNLKREIKLKVDNLQNALLNDYNFNKNNTTRNDLKKELLNLVKSQNKIGDDGYIFVLDKNGKALVHNIKRLQGKILINKKDLNGVYTFRSKVEILKTKNSSFQELFFEKPKEPNKQFKKLVYFTKFEPFDWIIGTGKYVVDEEKRIQQKIAHKYNTIQSNLSNYLFVAKLHNIDGGKDFATMLVMPNKPQLIGKKISDDKKDAKGKYHRKEYLKGLKKDGQVYLNYWYKKPYSNEQGQKLSYFYHYKPWNWLVGAGFYFDDLEENIKYNEMLVEKQIQNKLKNSITIGIILLVIALIVFFLFAKNITTQISNYIKEIAKKNEILKKQQIESKEKNSIMIQQSKMAAMGEMIGNIAHQWRQPLNALGLTVQKIKLYHEEDMLTAKQLDKSVEKSKMLIEKMSTTIDDFRNFFRVDKIKQEFYIKDAISETLDLLGSSLESKNIIVNKDNISEDIIILGFKNELEQVLLNIINNAKDALVENNIQSPKIDISVIENNEVISISIIDNAGGIPKDIINSIFDPYFTTKEQGKGTGIGLYMSNMIIQTNMNGDIKVKNIDDGACFTIELKKDIKQND